MSLCDIDGFELAVQLLIRLADRHCKHIWILLLNLLLTVERNCWIKPLNVHLFIFLLKFGLELVKYVASSVATIIFPSSMVISFIVVVGLRVSTLARLNFLGYCLVTPWFSLAVHIILISLFFLNLIML